MGNKCGGGHHKPAISDALRRGSSEAGKVMQKWKAAKKSCRD